MPRTLLALALALLPACAAFQGPDRDLVARDLGSLAEPEARLLDRLDPASPLSAPDEPPPADAGPEEYVRLALARSPALAAARQRVLRLRERVAQVTAPPDPMLEVTPIGEMDKTVAGEVMVMTGLSQTIPYPGRLAAAGRIADQESLIAARELRQAEVELAGEVRRAYWGLYAAERSIERTARARDALTQIREAALARYRAGQGTQADVLLAGVELAEVEQRLVELRADRESAAALLNSMLDRAPDAPTPVAARAEPATLDRSLSDLSADAARLNPRLAALREEVELARRRRHAAHLERFPDLTATFSYNLVDADAMIPGSSGDDQWSIGVGINLPLFRQGRAAAEREATRGILETAARVAQEQNRIAYRLREALSRLAAQRDQIALLDESILPQARQALESSRAAYASGVAEFTGVIENWNRILSLELMRERLVADTHASVASLAEAIGLDPLAEIRP